MCVCVSKLYGDQARFFDAEKAPRIKHKKKGTVSMVNNGNEQHGSQVLFIYFLIYASLFYTHVF